MSVRRNTAKAPSRSMNNMNSGANLLKSLAFWLLLAGGSFVIGLFIISPLINAAQSHSGTPAQPTPNPSPTTAAVAPSVTRNDEAKPARRAPDSAVDISPEAPKSEENGDVQKPVGLDENSVAPPARSENPGEGDTSDKPRRRRDTNRDENGDTGVRADRSEGVQRSDNLENGDQSDTSAHSSRTGRTTRDNSTDASEDPKPRRHRRTAPQDNGETPRRTRDTNSRDNGVQRSEGIDR